MEDTNSKENKIRMFGAIEKDESLTAELKRHKKDAMMLETLLEIRDMLDNSRISIKK